MIRPRTVYLVTSLGCMVLTAAGGMAIAHTHWHGLPLLGLVIFTAITGYAAFINLLAAIFHFRPTAASDSFWELFFEALIFWA